MVQPERLLDEAESAAEPATAAAAEALFHQAVVRAGGNTLLTELYDTLSVAVTEQIGAMPWVPETAARARLHRGLLAAIAARDEVGATGDRASSSQSQRATGPRETTAPAGTVDGPYGSMNTSPSTGISVRMPDPQSAQGRSRTRRAVVAPERSHAERHDHRHGNAHECPAGPGDRERRGSRHRTGSEVTEAGTTRDAHGEHTL